MTLFTDFLRRLSVVYRNFVNVHHGTNFEQISFIQKDESMGNKLVKVWMYCNDKEKCLYFWRDSVLYIEK